METVIFNKTKRRIILLLFFSTFTFISLKSDGQVTSVYAEFSDSARALDALYGTFFISRIDTLHAAQIEIKIGDAENDTVAVVNQVIDFDEPNGVPSGFFYSRQKDKISIGVSSTQAIWTYYCSVRIKDSSGNWGNSYKFITN